MKAIIKMKNVVEFLNLEKIFCFLCVCTLYASYSEAAESVSKDLVVENVKRIGHTCTFLGSLLLKYTPIFPKTFCVVLFCAEKNYNFVHPWCSAPSPPEEDTINQLTFLSSSFSTSRSLVFSWAQSQVKLSFALLLLSRHEQKIVLQ